MSEKLIEVDTTSWECLNCHETGNAELSVPDKCPNCGSTNIFEPLVKKGGPFDDLEPEKKY